MRKKVYIAGPLSSAGDLLHNINQATAAFVQLAKLGFAPCCPHWSVYSKPAKYELFRTTSNSEMVGFTRKLVCEATAMGNDEMTHADWMGVDLPWVAAADAVLRLLGASKGADIEVEHAGKCGVPVFTTVEDVVAWFKNAEAA